MARRIIWPVAASKFAGICVPLSIAIGPLTQQATAAGSEPQEMARSFYGVLLSTMQDGRALGQSGRYSRLASVVNRMFDIPSMTRLAIGPHWGTLSPAQQQQLVAAFEHYVAATYADRFDAYSGEQLQVNGERPHGADVMVETHIIKSNGETTRLDYLMRQNEGSWRISDVYLDGSISQLAVHRSEFHSIFQREGFDGLVLALNRKVDLLSTVARAS